MEDTEDALNNLNWRPRGSLNVQMASWGPELPGPRAGAG